MEPCVELRLEADGINIQIESRMAPGQPNWTPEEAARWMAWIVSDVHAILLQRAVSGDTSPRRLVKSGWRSWERPEEMPPLLSREEITAMNHPVPPLEETDPETQTIVEAIAEKIEEMSARQVELSAEEVGAALQTPPPPDVPAAPARPAQDPAKTKPGKAILQALKKSREPLDITGVREKSGLSDYMTRKTLKDLTEAGKITEGWEEIGGRWGSKAIYSPK